MNYSRGEQNDDYYSLFSKSADDRDPHLGQQSNSMFDRQDSLAIASSLQEVDRSRTDAGFMEEKLNFDEYLEVFVELDVPPDHLDLDDQELKKANILYDEKGLGPDCFSNDLFPTFSNDFSSTQDSEHQTLQPSQSCLMPDNQAFSLDEDSYTMNFERKLENNEDQMLARQAIGTKKSTRQTKRPAYFYEDSSNQYNGNDSTSDSSRASPEPRRQTKRGRKSAAANLMSYQPTTQARKYNLKPEQEKTQPVYKMKRARNNDAVRRSRHKAKEAQKLKEEENKQDKIKIAELKGRVEALEKQIELDKKIIKDLICGKESKTKLDETVAAQYLKD